jgi:cyd operon protein YbgT
MWYFAWILGVVAAVAIGVINVMWYEFQDELERNGVLDVRQPRPPHD